MILKLYFYKVNVEKFTSKCCASPNRRWFFMFYVPNRKRFACCHRVMVTRVKFETTRNAVETRAAGECFHRNFELFSSRVLPQLYGNTGKRFVLFLWNKSKKQFSMSFSQSERTQYHAYFIKRSLMRTDKDSILR